VPRIRDVDLAAAAAAAAESDHHHHRNCHPHPADSIYSLVDWRWWSPGPAETPSHHGCLPLPLTSARVLAAPLTTWVVAARPGSVRRAEADEPIKTPLVTDWRGPTQETVYVHTGAI